MYSLTAPLDSKEANLDVLVVDQVLGKRPKHIHVTQRWLNSVFSVDWKIQNRLSVLQISVRSVEREWRFPRAWLQNQIMTSQTRMFLDR